jgi:peptidyl-prolyl cis-trans isomerase C
VKALLHFIVLGGVLYAAKSLWPMREAPIAISAADVAALRAEWSRETRRAPSHHELEAQIRQRADEEMLVREALRLGLDRRDPVVASRLVRNMRFVGAMGDDAALLAQAVALDLARRDVVARRRLVQAMHERLAAGVSLREAEVRDYVARHASRYARAARVSFRQRFAGAGDAPVLLAREMVDVGEDAIARSFGREFADAVMQAPPGKWVGPVTSAYGSHEIFVVARAPGEPADDASVLRQAWYALREEREREAVATATRALRRRYPVTVEPDAIALAPVDPR